MDKHLTVKEATEFTGKSESTIKRLIREITADSDHPERSQVTPSHNELEKRKAAGEPYVWKIDKSLLEKRYPQEGTHAKESETLQSQDGGVTDGDRIITVLEKTVAVLKDELIEKNKQIAEFQERQREQNLLIKNFQEQLSLAAPKARAAEEPVVVDSRPEEGSQRAKNSEPAQESSNRTTSIWHREFHLFGKKSS